MVGAAIASLQVPPEAAYIPRVRAPPPPPAAVAVAPEVAPVSARRPIAGSRPVVQGEGFNVTGTAPPPQTVAPPVVAPVGPGMGGVIAHGPMITTREGEASGRAVEITTFQSTFNISPPPGSGLSGAIGTLEIPMPWTRSEVMGGESRRYILRINFNYGTTPAATDNPTISASAVAYQLSGGFASDINSDFNNALDAGERGVLRNAIRVQLTNALASRLPQMLGDSGGADIRVVR